jgi:hypothetical protein
MTNQRRYRIQGPLSIKHDTHTFMTIFYLLQYLTSLLLPTSEGTTDTVHNVKV